jgi:hypothetical protein
LVFKKNANFFRRKLAKIAEISDHNIDPWFYLVGIVRVLLLGERFELFKRLLVQSVLEKNVDKMRNF